MHNLLNFDFPTTNSEILIQIVYSVISIENNIFFQLLIIPDSQLMEFQFPSNSVILTYTIYYLLYYHIELIILLSDYSN